MSNKEKRIFYIDINNPDEFDVEELIKEIKGQPLITDSVGLDFNELKNLFCEHDDWNEDISYSGELMKKLDSTGSMVGSGLTSDIILKNILMKDISYPKQSMKKLEEVKRRLEEARPEIVKEIENNIYRYGVRYYHDNGIVQSIEDEGRDIIRDVVVPGYNKLAFHPIEREYDDFIEKWARKIYQNEVSHIVFSRLLFL